ncbi:MAG: hypothetical protein K6B45_01140 [Bacteroidaceae bacterium]|nr:hypothetical protein [Bacteroidaceae bacterium]
MKARSALFSFRKDKRNLSYKKAKQTNFLRLSYSASDVREYGTPSAYITRAKDGMQKQPWIMQTKLTNPPIHVLADKSATMD